MKWEEREAVAVVSQPHGCPVWPRVLPPLRPWRWPWAPHHHGGMCLHNQKVGVDGLKALACLLQERKVTSMTVRSRERFLVAEWWGKAKVRRDWPGVRCRCPAGPASAVVRSLRSLLTAQEGPSLCPILPCGCCHTEPGRLWDGWGCPGSGVTGCASVSHAQSWAESPPQWCEHQVRSFLRPTSR